eukprot:3819389-Pleurochrysis_carterae.AAC.2
MQGRFEEAGGESGSKRFAAELRCTRVCRARRVRAQESLRLAFCALALSSCCCSAACSSSKATRASVYFLAACEAADE